MINITNYETFFLLYADNELSAVEREAVLLFVNENPLLADEFTSINGTKISAESDVVFPNKNFLYVETVDELEELYSFKPNLEIQYLHKEGLYRYEKSFRIGWVKSFMAAASIILVAGLFWIFTGKRETVDQGLPISYQQKISSPNKIANIIAEKKNKFIPIGVANKIDKKSAVFYKENRPKKNSKQEVQLEQAEQDVATIFKSEILVDVQTASAEKISEIAVDPFIASEPIFVNAVAKSETSVDQNNYFTNTDLKSSKKTPFRGLIRKINRLVGKDRPESDQVKFVQVANFQLAIAQ